MPLLMATKSISAPTGKLEARYARKFAEIKCNTVHRNFFIPVGNQEGNRINWSLFDVCAHSNY